jgi:hypothetical protein
MKLGPPKIVAIDNCGRSIPKGPHRDAYFAAVKELICAVAAGAPHPGFERVARCLGRDCAKDIQAAFGRAMLQTRAVAEDVLILARVFSSNEFYLQQLNDIDLEVKKKSKKETQILINMDSSFKLLLILSLSLPLRRNETFSLRNENR